jgi:hypothetical protein
MSLRIVALFFACSTLALASSDACARIDQAKVRKSKCERRYLSEVAKAAPAKVADPIRLAATDCIAKQIEAFVEYSPQCPKKVDGR